MTNYKPSQDSNNLASPNYRSQSIYVAMTKECGEASGRVYQTLTNEEQAQMQKYMRQSCKMEDGTLNIHDCPLTRRMFAGFFTK